LSNEYDQQIEQDEQGFGFEGAHIAQPLHQRSSGLIRAGLVGVVLFLAVIGMLSVVNNWFRGSSDVEEKLAEITVETAPTDGVSPYKQLEKSWLDTRALLEIELQNKEKLQVDVSNLEAEIVLKEQNAAKAEDAVSEAKAAVKTVQKNLKTIAGKIRDLDRNTPQESFEDAQLIEREASQEAEAAKLEFERAKAEQVRIEATVGELRRAANAADSAAKASRSLVSAAASAREAVSENQDVMAEADELALSNLENNFFKDAEQQAIDMERSANAARQAVELAERRLESLKKAESKFQKQSVEAAEEAKAAKSVLAAVEKEVEAHVLKMQKVQNENTATQEILSKSEAKVEAETEALQLANREVAASKGVLKNTRDSISQSEDTLRIVEKNFRKTEEDLKDLNRRRSEENAVLMAALNSNLNEKLRGTLSGAAPDHPIFDRLVFSSAELFSKGSAELQQSGKDILLKVAPVLSDVVANVPADVDWVVRIDGHTDNLPITGAGRFKDNWELSQARALSVVRFLVAATDLLPEQLSANGYGEFHPLTPDTSPTGLAKNRRVELTLAAH